MKKATIIIFFCIISLNLSPNNSDIINLGGEWRFSIDPTNNGINEKWFKKKLVGKISLPGTIDQAGLAPKNQTKPNLLGPKKIYNYNGAAWYQRDLLIPKSWKGKRITLFLERCYWVTSVWLNEKKLGSRDSLIAPHFYELGTDLKPGHYTLTIRVDNTVKINLGVFVSALFGGTHSNMNGIIGKIELTATPLVWIDNVQAYPDISNKSLKLKIKIGNKTGNNGTSIINIQAVGKEGIINKTSTRASWSKTGGEELIWTINFPAKLWDEFSPNLYKIIIVLNSDNYGIDKKELVVGMREIGRKDTQFTLNNSKIFLRGTLECNIFPITGYPPMDVLSWQKIFQTIKQYGLNHMRFHSWCPPKAAFEAADIEGIILQVEAPIANVQIGENNERDKFIEAELRRIIDTYGNHPSFCLMSLGNEFGGDNNILTKWIDMLMKLDPRHLYSSAACGQNTDNRQFTVTCDGRGIHGANTNYDLRRAVLRDSRPIIGHEIGQWLFFPDFNEIQKYNGVMKVDNYEIIREGLKKNGLLAYYDEIYQAVGKHAILLYKEEIEQMLRTQGYAGFQLLSLQDYPTQGTALIGPLNAFWESKGFISPEKHRQYCGQVVPLLRIPKRIYTNNEVFEGLVEISNYSQSDIINAEAEWFIKDQKGNEISRGSFNIANIQKSKISPLGKIAATLERVKIPSKLTVTVSMKNTVFSNQWEIWVYPENKIVKKPEEIIIAHKLDDFIKLNLKKGKKVLFISDKFNPQVSMKGAYIPVFWSPIWFPNQKPNTMSILCDPNHPLFSQFPSDSFSNWQWFDLLNNSNFIILNNTPLSYRPILQVIDNFARNHKIGAIFEGRYGNAKILICSIDLIGKLANNPAARQLLKSIYNYISSDKFNPSTNFSLEFLGKILIKESQLKKLNAKIVHVNSMDSEHPANYAIDGNPETFWHTKWRPNVDPMPHSLVIDLGRELDIRGLTYLPRQDMANGRIGNYEILIGTSKNNCNTLIHKGRFPNTNEEQRVIFTKPVKTRFLKLIITSEVQGNHFASLAELDVILK